MPELAMLVPIALVLAGIIFIVVLFKAMWKVPAPNEALLISGFGKKPTGDEAGLGFKIQTGSGTFVVPGLQVAHRFPIDLRTARLDIQCSTSQGIEVGVVGHVSFKVGDDDVSIGRAARRFLGENEQAMQDEVYSIFEGHLRSIVGNMTMEQLISDRKVLAQQAREASAEEMQNLGLVVNSLQLTELKDPTKYIANLAKPHLAAVQRDARIAEANANQLASQREQETAALVAQAERDSAIKQAGFKAEKDRALAQADQAGPLQEATSRQEVIRAETLAAELEAALTEQRLQTDTVKPAAARKAAEVLAAEAARQARILAAQAQAQETRDVGDAEAHAILVRGESEASARKALGLADAAAIEARAQALAENQEAVIAQQLAERYPEIVAAAAKSFEGIGNMVVLNGAAGIEDILAKILTMGGAGFGVAKQLIEDLSSNGTHTTSVASPFEVSEK